MKLGQKISSAQFIWSQILILAIGLSFLAGIYYIVNIQYPQPKTLFSNGPVTTAPKSLRLELEQPTEDLLSYSSTVVVSGKTSPSKDILISQDMDDTINQSKPDGSFSAVLNLNEGVNKITVAVFDSKGDFRSAERTIYYSKEKL